MAIHDGGKGLLTSLGAHVVFFLLIGAAGYQSYQAEKVQDPVYTVNIVGGSPYHGFGTAAAPRSGNGSPPAPSNSAQAPQSASAAAPAVPIQAPSEDAIPDGEVQQKVPAGSPATEMAASSEAVSAAAASTGDPNGGSLNGGDPDGGNPDGSPDEPPGPAGPDGPGDGPDFDTDAIQPDISPAFLSGDVPEYPDALRSHGIQGRVRVQMVVGRDGSVESASVISGSGYGAMDAAAVEAAYTYQFEPAEKQGIPVRCYATKTFVFGLH